MIKLEWVQKEGYKEAKYKRTSITIEERPAYCDRGNYIVKIESSDLHIDAADMFPRYYFDLIAAKCEVEAFINKRNEYHKTAKKEEKNFL